MYSVGDAYLGNIWIGSMNNASSCHDRPRFCKACGIRLPEAAEKKFPYSCNSCGAAVHDGPQLLVICLIFAENKMLLMKRGQPPFAGSWAPPGGFVDANESLQDAASREVLEEVGVVIEPSLFVPHAMGSEPTLNQAYCGFTCVLERATLLQPRAPEASDAGWFSVDKYPKLNMWPPAERFNYLDLFSQMQSKRFFFYQWTGSNVRVFNGDIGKL